MFTLHPLRQKYEFFVNFSFLVHLRAFFVVYLENTTQERGNENEDWFNCC